MRWPLALGRALRAKFLSTLSINRRSNPKLRRATRPVVDELERRTMLTALPAFVHTSGNVVVGCNLQGDGSMLIDFWGGTASFDQNITAGGPDFAHTRIEVHDDAQVILNAPQTLRSLSLFDSAKVIDSQGNLADGHGNVLDLSGLSIGPNATLDLIDNGAILRYSPDATSEQAALANVRSLLVSGYAGGSWTGTGIVSSLAAADPNHNTAVGYADNVDLGDSSFDGLDVSDQTEVLIQYTYYGDADLSGMVNAADASLIAGGLAGSGTGWDFGDFNYSGGQTDSADQAIFQSGYGLSVSNPLLPRAFSPAGFVLSPIESTPLSADIATFTDTLHAGLPASDYMGQVYFGSVSELASVYFDSSTGQFRVSAQTPALTDPDALMMVLIDYAPDATDANGNPITGRGAAVGEPILLLPAAPTGLTATASLDTEIDLAWTNPSSIATGVIRVVPVRAGHGVAIEGIGHRRQPHVREIAGSVVEIIGGLRRVAGLALSDLHHLLPARGNAGPALGGSGSGNHQGRQNRRIDALAANAIQCLREAAVGKARADLPACGVVVGVGLLCDHIPGGVDEVLDRRVEVRRSGRQGIARRAELVVFAGHTTFDEQYTLRNDGLRGSVKDTRYDSGGNVFSQIQIAWDYDGDQRLKSEALSVLQGAANAPSPYTDGFKYDLANNRVEEDVDANNDGTTDQITRYGYNNDDQRLAEAQTNASDNSTIYSVTRGYDNNGSLTSQVRTGANPETDSYEYDARNRMTLATVNGVSTTYAYDDDNVRVSEIGAKTTYYLNDPQNPTGYTKAVEESNQQNGAPTRSFLLGNEVIVQSDSHGVLYLMHDGHGSTRALLGSTGNLFTSSDGITQQIDYAAFGDVLPLPGGVNNADQLLTPWGFAGDGLRDSVTGWRLTISRPINGFWLPQRDPRLFGPGQWQDGNLHLYVGANPVNAWDPTGNDDFSLVGELVEFGVEDFLEADADSTIYPVWVKATAVATALGILAGGGLAWTQNGSPNTILGQYLELVQPQLQANPVATGQAYKQAAKTATASGKYTKLQVQNMPIFWVFKTGPDATRQIWQNDYNAMKGIGTKGGASAPDVLTYFPGINNSNRYGPKGALTWAASMGIVAGSKQSLDEYPFASTTQGGSLWPWLRVAPVAETEQDQQRDDLRTFYQSNGGFKPFTFLVVLVP